MQKYIAALLNEEMDLPYYVKIVGGLKNQMPIDRPHGYPYHQWLHCIQGKGRFFIDNKEFIIKKNMGLFIPPDIPHSYFAIEEPWEMHFVSFTGEGVPLLLDLLRFKSYGVYTFSDIRHLDTIITDIYNKAKTNTLPAKYKSSSLLYSLLIEIKNHILENSDEIERARHRKLQPVISFIETHYARDISIDDMAGVINVSPQFLCRLFRQTLHLRPFAYLTNVRMKKAKEIILNQQNVTMNEVSLMVGYKDQSYFSTVFKKNEGLTPLEYKMLYT